jgi:hypothetical protein
MVLALSLFASSIPGSIGTIFGTATGYVLDTITNVLTHLI